MSAGGGPGGLPRARVIALGGRLAGDDAVGLAVLDHLRRAGALGDADLEVARDASAVIEAARGCRRLIVVDAALTEDPPGTVTVHDPLDLASRDRDGVAPARLLSSHGLGLLEALQLATSLWPETRPTVRVVVIGIAAARRGSLELSPEVAAAVPHAAEVVRANLA